MNLPLRLHLLFFPPACWRCRRLMDPLGRERPGFPFLCEACYGAVAWKDPSRSCRRCGRWTAETDRLGCPGCAEEESALDGVVAVGFYLDPVRHWIRSLKYRRQDTLAPLLGSLLAESPALRAPQGIAALAEADLALPVPLHPRRIRRRGFNQAHLLAGQGLEALRRRGRAVPPLRTHLLRRHKNTRPQVEITRAERHANVADAFSVVAPPAARTAGEPPAPSRDGGAPPRQRELAGRSLLLIDDVMTTGATLDACARTLKAAGTAKVTALVLARL